jgi:sugar/nucleoside kinase (ribokinase family)
MKIGIASHIVLDTIRGTEGTVAVESIGGPPCYCGMTARQFGFDVELATRVGGDFPPDKRDLLSENGIALRDWHIARDSLTTRFELENAGSERRLVLRSRCEPIDEQQIARMKNMVDCWLVSPVFDEVPPAVLAAIVKNRGKKNFVMLDPQGYMRAASGPGGQIMLRSSLAIDLAGVTAVKADQQELAALAGGGLTGLEGMKALQSRGVEFVLATEHRAVHLLHKDMHYWVKLRDVDTPDSTGAGDILAAAFACAWVREKDPVWAISFAAGALRAALETRQAGLAKIPPMAKIETSASYFYNTVGFQSV